MNRFDPTSEDNAPQSRELAKFRYLANLQNSFDYFVNSQKKRKKKKLEQRKNTIPWGYDYEFMNFHFTKKNKK